MKIINATEKNLNSFRLNKYLLLFRLMVAGKIHCEAHC